MSQTTAPGRGRSLILFVSIALAAGCTAAMVTPRAIPAAQRPGATRGAILRALAKKGWTYESERPGEIIARYAERNWNMTVAVDYAEQVSIRYVSSENLNYRIADGTPVIHHGYNNRVLELANQIGSDLAIARIHEEPSPVAVPPPGAAPQRSPGQ